MIRMTPPTDVRVCVFGDSFVAGVGDVTGAGWVTRVGAAARAALGDRMELTLYNCGVRRETTADVRARWRAEAAPRLRFGDRHGLVLAAGLNDVGRADGVRRVPRERTAADLAALLDGARDQGLPLLVVGPPPLADPQVDPDVAELSAMTAALCGDRGVPFVDVYSRLAAEPAWPAHVAAGDGLHPDTDGYTRMAALIAPVFLEWLDGRVLSAAASSRAGS